MSNFGQKNTPLDSEAFLKLHLTFIEHCFYSTLLLANTIQKPFVMTELFRNGFEMGNLITIGNGQDRRVIGIFTDAIFTLYGR